MCTTVHRIGSAALTHYLISSFSPSSEVGRARINHPPHSRGGNWACEKWEALLTATRLAAISIGLQIRWLCHSIIPYAFLTTEEERNFFFSKWDVVLDMIVSCWSRWAESLTTGEFREGKHCFFRSLWMTAWWLYQYNFKTKERRVKPSCLTSYLVSCKANKKEYISVILEVS